MPHKNRPAELFPPGEFLREELEARGWSQVEFAEILGRPVQVVNEIVAGKKALTPETAKALGQALGTSAELWLNLDAAYRLSRVPDADDRVARRSRLYSVAPVRELAKRGWIKSGDDLDKMEEEVKRFLGIQTLDEAPPLVAQFRKSAVRVADNPSLLAWLCRAAHVARAKEASAFSVGELEGLLRELPHMSMDEDSIRKVPQVLAAVGVRLVIVESLPKTFVDGAAFWIEPKSPVVALSLRYDRVDHFWFALMHELAHLLHDGETIGHVDVALLEPPERQPEQRPESLSAQEKRANALARECLIPQRELDTFIRTTKPYYSRKSIESFARRLKVHPGLVVGQLHFRGEIPYSHHRALLPRVRQALREAG